MGFRPTISIYINGHIADIGYYKYWECEDLFFEAFAIAALFNKCQSISEYNDKRFGRQKVYYSIDPVIYEKTEENLKVLENCSEWPVLVDLTAKCIYINEGALEKSELLDVPSALEMCKNFGYVKCLEDGISYTCALTSDYEDYEKEIISDDRVSIRNIYWVMEHCRIPFDHLNMDEILNIFMEYHELWRHLSNRTVELLQRENEQKGK